MQNDSKKSVSLNFFLGTVVLSLFSGSNSFAQNSNSGIVEEIIVTGSRSLTRTATEAPVPVDVFQGNEFQDMGTGDMDDILRTLVPSYNVERFPLDDEASLIRPATLRGLPADNTLILINGKRRHRAGALTGGAQGPDVTAIPAIALQRVEVLRDGASAQYGSDAIAGVINYITLEQDTGFNIELKTGEFFEGDGHLDRIGANAGMSLLDDGFANLAVEYGSVDSTTRSEQRFDARALQDLGVAGIPNPVQKYGQPIIDSDLKIFANAAIPIGQDSELYGFGNYSKKDAEVEFFWRNPNASGGIYRLGRERLVYDLTADGTGGCPQPGTENAIPVPNQFFPTIEDINANSAAIASIAADPNCWTVSELYPSGFNPAFSAKILDRSAVVGFRGSRTGGMRYDLSLSFGESDVDFRIANTLNPSLGPDSPTEFNPGANVQSEINFNADFVWPIEIDGFASPLSVASGFEWREESFETVAGGESSWLVGRYFTQGASIGSNGYPGFPPEQAGKWSRSNWATYLDLEADITVDLMLGLAIRHEDFQDFNTTTNYKGAIRYQINDMVALRGSYSTGFRAPTPGQANSNRVETRGFNSELVNGGRIPPTNSIARYFGGKPLEPEESKNLSAGLSLQPLPNLILTADYFEIDVDNRIGLSPDFGISPQDITDLVAQGVPGASDFRFVNFFTNGTDTETKGFDIVATYSRDWNNGGASTFSLAWNQTETSVVSMDIPNRDFVIDLEERPLNRGILTFNHKWRDFRFLLRASYYDSWASADAFILPDTAPLNCADPGTAPPNPPDTDECYGSTWMLDAEIAYTFLDNYTVILGADNVLDQYPEEDLDYPDFSFGVRYPRGSPIGYNGGFWYLRVKAEL